MVACFIFTPESLSEVKNRRIGKSQTRLMTRGLSSCGCQSEFFSFSDQWGVGILCRGGGGSHGSERIRLILHFVPNKRVSQSRALTVFFYGATLGEASLTPPPG